VALQEIYYNHPGLSHSCRSSRKVSSTENREFRWTHCDIIASSVLFRRQSILDLWQGAISAKHQFLILNFMYIWKQRFWWEESML